MKQYIAAALCVFLIGCSAYKPVAIENTVADYSGGWCYLNDPDLESGGGVSLKATISGQLLEAKLSAWSSNYNRLADADLSGIIEDHKAACRFDDDGRGHTGEVVLTLKDNTIQMDVTIDKDSANGDFTFPEGTTILQRPSENQIPGR